MQHLAEQLFPFVNDEPYRAIAVPPQLNDSYPIRVVRVRLIKLGDLGRHATQEILSLTYLDVISHLLVRVSIHQDTVSFGTTEQS